MRDEIDINYIIFSDIDDTLYTGSIISKRIEHNHELISKMENKHIIIITARPEISIMKYLTNKKLHKDFSDYVLLMGNFFGLIVAIAAYIIYFITFKYFTWPMTVMQRTYGNCKIDKFNSYIQTYKNDLFKKTCLNVVIFLGDNLQGDLLMGRFICNNLSSIIKNFDVRYVVFIRDALDDLKNMVDPNSTTIRNIVADPEGTENLYFTSKKCNSEDIMKIVHTIVNKN